jgi:predicted helicase
MTATPRFITAQVKDGDVELASMDDPTVYGPVFHRLTFGEAISRRLLCDYRIAIIGIDDETIYRQVKRRGLLTIDGETITDAHSLAAELGLLKAADEFNLRRVITYHNKLAPARRFGHSLQATYDWMTPETHSNRRLWTAHVSGTMMASQRHRILDQLRDSSVDSIGVVTNVRCLAEGVDVPAIDGISFIDPRRSTVDVVQAVGRAIRQAPDKSVATIVLPVFVDSQTAPEVAMTHPSFEAVWQVLKAIRAHDEEIAEALDRLRRELGHHRLSQAVIPRLVVDMPSSVDVSFIRALSIRVVELATASFEFWLGLLDRFVDREGHANVSASHWESGHKLGSWVSQQRTDFNRGFLVESRRDRLEEFPGWV